MDPSEAEPELSDPDTAAAAWVARLRGPGRSASTEEAFHAWAARDPAHRDSFHRATTLWEALGGAGRVYRWGERRRRRRLAGGVALAAGLAAAAVMAFQSRPPAGQTFASGRGEQRILTLADGSVVTLNTDSQVTVRYRPGRRDLSLDRGEAFFKVARDADRPFVVVAGDRTVRALGTSFEVFRDRSDLLVTLVEGQVRIDPAAQGRGSGRRVTLRPGQRWTRASGAVELLDRGDLDAALAWRRQEVVLNDTPLSEAIEEMNRYTETPVVLEGGDGSDLRVSGLFSTHSTESFARTVAALYGLRMVRAARTIRLVAAETAPPRGS